jgi:hypothetical protein
MACLAAHITTPPPTTAQHRMILLAAALFFEINFHDKKIPRLSRDFFILSTQNH